jgi:hypothetical protein
MLATIIDYEQRVKSGRHIEALILEAMRKRVEGRNVVFEEPTNQEDLYDKIDAWLINPIGKRYSVQIKYRESGDDIIFEVCKDIPSWSPGRDLLSVSQLYLFVDRDKTARLYWTAPIHADAQVLFEQAKKDLTEHPEKTQWFGEGYEMFRRPDRANGKDKLVAFFSPRRFAVIEQWNNLI